MPFNISRPHTQVLPLPIKFGEETITIYYKPHALSFDEAQALASSDIDAQADAEKMETMISYLLKYVERADWVDDTGQPAAFNRQILGSLPMALVQNIFSTVMDAVNGGGDKS